MKKFNQNGGGILNKMKAMHKRLAVLVNRAKETHHVLKNTVLTEFAKRQKYAVQPQVYFGLYTALCVDTQDPLKQNRVRFYSPLLNDPGTQIKQLDWASPCSAMGGFDDSGLNWVPPAGSLLIIGFERGYRQSAYYLGTTWTRDRGKDTKNGGVPQYKFNYSIPEFLKLYDNHREGYLSGPDDGSQVLPPWNTESMNGLDVNLSNNEVPDDDAINQANVTTPNIYGCKTPQKLGWKLVDGNPDCHYRWKRAEYFTNYNWILMKDDMLHPGGQWANPQCCTDGGGDVSQCSVDGVPTETDQCMDPSSLPKCANKFFKHKSECRPYTGPGTPQNNKCAIDQGGMQFLDMAGNTMIFDSSVEQPTLGDGVPWERGTEPFDFGCTNKYTGKMKMISATGHRIEMNDEEDIPTFRGPNNGIRLISATGNYLFLCDDTNSSNIATKNRGLWAGSTSGHTFEMCDSQNVQASPSRSEIDSPSDEATQTVNLENFNRPQPAATQAYIRLRSGYGLTFMMADYNSQQHTQQQFIQILSPQTDNTIAGPHILRFQEAPSGPGYVLLRVGGKYICATYDNHYTFVGITSNPSNKITNVTGATYIHTEQEYMNVAYLHEFIADTLILLLAGQDCPSAGGMEPCPFPVLVYQPQQFGPGRIVISDRVYASASPAAQVANVFALWPFAQ